MALFLPFFQKKQEKKEKKRPSFQISDKFSLIDEAPHKKYPKSPLKVHENPINS